MTSAAPRGPIAQPCTAEQHTAWSCTAKQRMDWNRAESELGGISRRVAWASAVLALARHGVLQQRGECRKAEPSPVQAASGMAAAGQAAAMVACGQAAGQAAGVVFGAGSDVPAPPCPPPLVADKAMRSAIHRVFARPPLQEVLKCVKDSEDRLVVSLRGERAVDPRGGRDA